MSDLDIRLNDENIRMILEKDYLDRNKYLTGLMEILNNIEKSQIIALDGDWGSGKTWFVKSLEYLLNNDYNFKANNLKYNIIESIKSTYMTFYYNAWENDDSSSAMLSLIYKLINDSSLEKEADSVSVFPKIMNALVKYATNGTVDIKNDFFSEDWTNKQITDCIKTSEEIKSEFKELINNLLVENKNKILIIIDEIDRCKPLFAIDLLENIKHFYDDDRIVFLIATNNKELSACVKKVYGNEYDGAAYLDKFFDINLELPNNYLEKYIHVLNDNKESSYYMDRGYIEIAKTYSFTMREFNRYQNSIKFIENYLSTEDWSKTLDLAIKNIFVILALALKIKNKAKYYEFIKGNLFEQVEDLINKNEFFYDLGYEILKSAKNRELREFESQQSQQDKEAYKNNEKKLILQNLKEIYDDIYGNSKSNNGYEYKRASKELINIMSMMN